jgi:hypothetical protein
MPNKISKNLERFSQTEEQGSEKKEEKKRTLEIPDEFWNKLRAKVGANIGNPQYVDIIFHSQKPSIQNSLHRIHLIDPESEKDWVIVGHYDVRDGSIHFNIGPEDVPKQELARVLTHELVHLLQDEMEKYPQMGKKRKFNKQGVDTESPWEKEAYRLQELFYKDFLKQCEIY